MLVQHLHYYLVVFWAPIEFLQSNDAKGSSCLVMQLEIIQAAARIEIVNHILVSENYVLFDSVRVLKSRWHFDYNLLRNWRFVS